MAAAAHHGPGCAGGRAAAGVACAPARGAPSSPAATRGGEPRIGRTCQKARDPFARRILEAELRKEEERLAQLQKELAQGEAERRGDERNYARYLERVNEIKAAVARKEGGGGALRRE